MSSTNVCVLGGVLVQSNFGETTIARTAWVYFGRMSVPSAQAEVVSIRGGGGTPLPPPFPPLSCENAMLTAAVSERVQIANVLMFSFSLMSSAYQFSTLYLPDKTSRPFSKRRD